MTRNKTFATLLIAIIIVVAIYLIWHNQSQPTWHFDVTSSHKVWNQRGNIWVDSWTFRIYRLDDVVLTNVYVTADGENLKFIPIWDGSQSVVCQLDHYGTNNFFLYISWTGGEEGFEYAGTDFDNYVTPTPSPTPEQTATPEPIPTPTPTPTPTPQAEIPANLVVNCTLELAWVDIGKPHLKVLGSITNNGTETAYNVTIHVLTWFSNGTEAIRIDHKLNLYDGHPMVQTAPVNIKGNETYSAGTLVGMRSFSIPQDIWNDWATGYIDNDCI